MHNKKRLRADGFALLRLREDALLTQAELAGIANVHEVTISKIESGKVANPRVGTLKALAQALEVPVAVLYRPEKKDRADSPLNQILAKRAMQRELGITTEADDPPSMGRWGAAWDFDSEISTEGGNGHTGSVDGSNQGDRDGIGLFHRPTPRDTGYEQPRIAR